MDVHVMLFRYRVLLLVCLFIVCGFVQAGPTGSPAITAITNNTNGVWIDGVFNPEHLVPAHYRVVWSAGF